MEPEGLGGLQPDRLSHSFRRLLPEGGPSPACEGSGHTLVTRGEGGDIGVLGWGPRSPPVLHILIHSIFAMRQGTNISVLNSFPSCPRSLLLAPLWLSSLPSLAPHCHCHPTWAEDAPAGLGLARVLVAALGPCLGLLPSLSSSVPDDPPVLRGGGAAAARPAGH